MGELLGINSCWTLLLLRVTNEEFLSDKSFKLLGCSAPPDPVSVSMFWKLQLLWAAKTFISAHTLCFKQGEAFCLSLLEVLPCLPRSWEGRRSEGCGPAGWASCWQCPGEQPWELPKGFSHMSVQVGISESSQGMPKGCASSSPHSKQSRSQILTSLNSLSKQNRC